jgi:hypothetical protein
MDTVGAAFRSHPRARKPPAAQRRRGSGDHFYAPWWLYKEQKAGKLDFARGYHIELGQARSMPGGFNPVPEDCPAEVTARSSSRTPAGITAPSSASTPAAK